LADEANRADPAIKAALADQVDKMIRVDLEAQVAAAVRVDPADLRRRITESQETDEHPEPGMERGVMTA
jgi:hypothetical protein